MTVEKIQRADTGHSRSRPAPNRATGHRPDKSAESTDLRPDAVGSSPALVYFGLGLRLGVAIGAVVGRTAHGELDRHAMERFGRDTLAAPKKVLPEQLADRLAR